MWFRTSAKNRRLTSAPAGRSSFRPRLEALEDRCLMSAGALDPTFGAGAGSVTTTLSSGNNDQAKKILVQPSGNIVAVGYTNIPVTTTSKGKTTTTNVGVFGAVTYNPDGSLDTAFGSGGIVRQPFAGQGTTGATLYSAALESMGTMGDSKILLAGVDFAQGGMALMRLNANGSLDTTFGSSGQVITPFQTSGSVSQRAAGVAVTSNGQILVVGFDLSHTVLLARYNPNGSLDSTFGSGGKATTVFTSTATGFTATARGLALQPDGKFVVLGQQQWSAGTGSVREGMVLRYNANGSLDTTFGSGGIVTTAVPFGSSSETVYNDVAIYPNAGTANDGKIMAVGSVTANSSLLYPEWAAVRYNANGSLDTSFGNGAGSVVIANPQFTAPQMSAYAVAIESDGKPIIAGFVSGPGMPEYPQVARLNLDGSLDATFGNGGLVRTDIGSWNGAAGNGEYNDVAIQPDGKVLAAGWAQFGGNSGSQMDWSLARYLPSAPQIGSFTASLNPVTSGFSTTLTAANLTDGNSNSTITQVAFYVQINGTNTLLGYGTQTSPGVWTFSYTVNLAPGTYTLFAQAEDSYGVFGDLTALTLTVQ